MDAPSCVGGGGALEEDSESVARGPMVAVEEGGRVAHAAIALCVMYWLVLSYPFTLAITCLGTLLITVLIYLKTLFRTRDCLARLTCRDSTLSHHVTAHCHAFRRALRLPVLARNSHVQSVMGLLAREAGVEFRREYLQLSDGGLVALDWLSGCQYVPHGRPILMILPDLPASALQMGALCREALKLGLKAVVVNRRGQGGSLVNTPKLPGYGEASDLREVVEFLRQEEATLSAVGVGTGGDLLLSYLGEFGSSAHLSSAVCISPSYSGEGTMHTLPAPYSLLYLSHLKRSVLANAKVFGKTARKARATWSLREFDKRVTCPTGGWDDLGEFWADNEPLREADEISVPVLCISSTDDPVSGQKHIPHDLFRALPNFFLLTLPHGGHAGFRQSLHGLSWAENAAVDFVLAMLTFPSQQHHKHASLAKAEPS
nr:hypothetical protein BaRGS_011316 [Batillaria attramentaria]